MVKSCSAYKCSNESGCRSDLHFHCFPLKRPNILELWIRAVGRINWIPQKHSALCSDHFLDSDYEYRSYWIRPHLRPTAVPTVFNVRPPDAEPIESIVPQVNVECQPDIEAVFTNDESLENHVPEESPADCDPLAAKTFADVGVNTKPIVPTRKDLKRKIKTLRQKLRRQDVTINRLKEEVKRMRKESENSDTYYS